MTGTLLRFLVVPALFCALAVASHRKAGSRGLATSTVFMVLFLLAASFIDWDRQVVPEFSLVQFAIIATIPPAFAALTVQESASFRPVTRWLLATAVYVVLIVPVTMFSWSLG